MSWEQARHTDESSTILTDFCQLQIILQGSRSHAGNPRTAHPSPRVTCELHEEHGKMLLIRQEIRHFSHCSQLGFVFENPSARLSSLAQLPAQQESWDLVTAELPWGGQAGQPRLGTQAGPGLALSSSMCHHPSPVTDIHRQIPGCRGQRHMSRWGGN